MSFKDLRSKYGVSKVKVATKHRN